MMLVSWDHADADAAWSYCFEANDKHLIHSLICGNLWILVTGEDVKSMLGRAVLSIWLFVVLIIISSYTASLTSILTVQQLQPSIGGISSLLTSTVPIGYQTGSFVRDYLIQLGIAGSRLIPLNSIQDYAAALNKGSSHGGISAIVDELPYVNLFLSTECSFTQAGSEFTKSGWGFVCYTKTHPHTISLIEFHCFAFLVVVRASSFVDVSVTDWIPGGTLPPVP